MTMHTARNAEERSPAEMRRLEMADEYVRSHNLTRADLDGLLIAVRGLYRGPDWDWNDRQVRFLDDFARAIDDAGMDTTHDDPEAGQGLAEYALLVGVIAVGAIVALGTLGSAITAQLNAIGIAL